MAYMIDGKGPYPNRVDEYCGNHQPGMIPMARLGQTQEQTNASLAAYLRTMKFGRPRPCKAGTTAELEERGVVGLYARHAHKLRGREVAVPTPPEMMEPKAIVSGWTVMLCMFLLACLIGLGLVILGEVLR